MILLLVVIAGRRLADGLQREWMVGSWHCRSERTLPGKLHTASVVKPVWPMKTKLGRAEVCLCSLNEARLWRQLVLWSRTAGENEIAPNVTENYHAWCYSMIYLPLETRFYFVVVPDRFLENFALYVNRPLKNWEAKKKKKKNHVYSECRAGFVNLLWNIPDFIVLWPKL